MHRERRVASHDDSLKCTECLAAIKRTSKSRHACTPNKTRKKFQRFETPLSEDPYVEVVRELRNDDLGNAVRSDELLLKLVQEFFNRVENDAKPKPTADKTRSFVRLIAKIRYLVSGNHTSSLREVFTVSNVWRVKQALEEAFKSKEGITSNANVVTYTGQVKRAVELLELIMIEESDDESEKNLGRLRRLFAVRQEGKLRNSNQALAKSRNETNRAPENQLQEDNSLRLVQHIFSVLGAPILDDRRQFREL